MDWTVLAFAALGYLSGSIPYGLLFTRAAGLGDVRAIGSGNIGATNVLRTGSKKIAALTLLADALKGTLPTLACFWYAGEYAGTAAALGAFFGHLYPVWLGFKGGKGVATFLGVLLALSWQAFLAFAAIWLGVAFTFRYSSLAALCAVVASVLIGAIFSLPMTAAAILVMGAVVILRHHENIARLIRGEESRISFGQSKS